MNVSVCLAREYVRGPLERSTLDRLSELYPHLLRSSLIASRLHLARVDELAAEGDVSRNTVRSQLRAVLAKTGCARQAEVVALLSRIDLSAR